MQRPRRNRWIYSDMPYNLKDYMLMNVFSVPGQIIQPSFNETL
jgi:hypothetical protein